MAAVPSPQHALYGSAVSTVSEIDAMRNK